MEYEISVQRVEARPIAVVRARFNLRDFGQRYMPLYDLVYEAARSGAFTVTGHNLAVFLGGAADEVDVELGVQVADRFEDTGEVVCSETPGGEVAGTVHWGLYAKLPEAHEAVVLWSQANRRARTGVRWEVYGHWDNDPAKIRSEVFYLLNPIGP